MNITQYGSGVYTISNFLSPEECRSCIEHSERIGYEDATITTKSGQLMCKEIRNNDRVIFDDARLAEFYFDRAHQYLPREYNGWYIHGLNERFRFYRYENEQYFNWHRDGSFKRSDTESSSLTFIIYLNEGFIGGETRFAWDSIIPETGMALIFPHHLMHQGNAVTKGVKYALRTDVMYFDISAEL